MKYRHRLRHLRSRQRVFSGSPIAPLVQMSIQHDEYIADRTTTERLAIALGWFSVALGAAELFAPRQVGGLIGLPPSERTTATLRAYGAREIGTGLAILAQPGNATWLWSRVGGDALDIASLGAAAGQEGIDRARLCLATVAVAGVTALDVLAAVGLRGRSGATDEFGVTPTQEQGITIKAPLEAVEAAWLPWCTSGLSQLNGDYVIRFEPAPGARGTEMHIAGGASTGTIREELRRFKQRLETGEIPMSDGPGLSRAAQPRESAEVHTLEEVRS